MKNDAKLKYDRWCGLQNNIFRPYLKQIKYTFYILCPIYYNYNL